MSKYKLNFKRLALMLLPIALRKPVLANIAYAVVEPLSYLHRQFMYARADSNYRLKHNGQVCYMRKVLNDMFDPDPGLLGLAPDPNCRRITITESGSARIKKGAMVYRRAVDTEIQIFMRESDRPLQINRRGFDGINGYDFWVNVPQTVLAKTDVKRLRATVNTYKLASKRYDINPT